MSRRSFRTGLAIVVGTLVVAAIVVGLLARSALHYPDTRHAGAGREVEVEIKPGMAFPSVSSLLASRGVIARPTWFRLFAMYRGDTTRVKTGTYKLRDDLTPRQVLATLVAGVKDVTVTVTLPEGQHMLEYFARLGGQCPAGEARACPRVTDAAALLALARDKEFLAAHGIPGDSVEGYLFPDTYSFRVDEAPAKVLGRLITRHQQVWRELAQVHARELARVKDRLGWTDRDVLVMASIVEKEAVVAAERPRIAQVFINRLVEPEFKSRRLETDPTIRYGCTVPETKSAACQAWDPTQRLRRAQLDDVDNPYNTYRHAGLPPGPISNPGRSAIEATMDPDGSKFFYFVAKAEGASEHVFSRTYDEHKAAVARYVKSQD
ncbi:MAG: endolytic transglycosylase MltG [Kofleriaceae bacterium]